MPRAPRAALLAFAIVAASSPAPAATPDWRGRLALASDWAVRGLRLSDGGAPVGVAGIDVYPAIGWSLGATASALRDRSGRWRPAWSLRVGHERPLDARWLLYAELQYVGYDNGVLAGWSGPQVAVGLAFGDVASLSWNAEQPRNRSFAARSLDLNLRWPVVHGLALTGGLGRVYSAPGAHHGYGQAGVEWRAGDWQLRLERSGTGRNAQYTDPARRYFWMGSVQWSF
jgi:hypothetical protein